MGRGAGAARTTVGNHMDILKKFRYNFHYWLRNCYQAEEIQDIQNLQNGNNVTDGSNQHP